MSGDLALFRQAAAEWDAVRDAARRDDRYHQALNDVFTALAAFRALPAGPHWDLLPADRAALVASFRRTLEARRG